MNLSEIVIDEAFANLLPQAEQWRDVVLFADIEERGVLDPLKVWSERGVLIDGHRRTRILKENPRLLKRHGNPPVCLLSFDCEAEAMAWARSNQNGRRNITKVAEAVNEGLKVEPQKPGPKGDRCIDATNSTERSERHRNKETAEGWKAVADVSPEAAEQILTDADTEVTKQDLQQVAKASGEAREARAREVADKALKKPHVTNNSGENEWYTPPAIIEAAREAMGGIDLDPASSEVAQRNVQATRYHTLDDSGLEAEWNCGSVWLNPPYSAQLVKEFAAKLCAEYEAGRFKQACVLVNNATETGWFNELARIAKAICFLAGRVKFLDYTGEPANSPLQGQAVLFISSSRSAAEFIRVFSPLGHCWRSAQ